MRSTPSSKSAEAMPQEPFELEMGTTIEFMRVLWSLDHGLQSASKRMESRLGVTGQQRLVVRIIGRYPGLSAGRLATSLFIHPSTLTGILRRLEERGVVSRKSHPADGRRAELFLTAKGKRINSLTTNTIESTVRAALASMQAPDVEATRKVLSTLAAALMAYRA